MEWWSGGLAENIAPLLQHSTTPVPGGREKKEPDCSGSVVTRSRTPSPRRSEG